MKRYEDLPISFPNNEESQLVYGFPENYGNP